MNEKDLPPSEKLLLSMHNLCVVRPEIAKTGEEISKSINLDIDHVLRMLGLHEERGFVKSYVDNIGIRRFYLSGLGILKVCSSFT